MHPLLTMFVAALLPAVPSGIAGAAQVARPSDGRSPAAVAVDGSDPSTPEALTRLASVRLAEGQRDEARRLLLRALAISPNAPSANAMLGKMNLDSKQYPEAMERFEAVLAIDLRDAEARQGELSAATALALQARRAGNQEAALQCLQHAREHLPDDPTLLTDLGIQAQLLHQLPEASKALNAALKLAPGDANALYALARVETDWQHLPAAESYLRAYLALRPEDASAHFGLGHLLYMQQRVGDARAEFQRSIELQPVQTESFYQLGQIALDAHNDTEAASFFQKALARDARHGGALTGMGILAYRSKDYNSARAQLTAAVERSPEYQPAHYYLGLTLGRLGEKAASDRELALATQLAATQQAVPKPQIEGAPQ